MWHLFTSIESLPKNESLAIPPTNSVTESQTISQAPRATPGLAHDASADEISSALSALRPAVHAGVSVEVDRAGPSPGGGYRWLITFHPLPIGSGEGADRSSPSLPIVGVQEANVTGTGVRVEVERRASYEAVASRQLVSLSASLPPRRAEVQTVRCTIESGLTPDQAAKAGYSFTLEFREEQTEARGCFASKACVDFVLVREARLSAERGTKTRRPRSRLHVQPNGP